MEKPRRSGRVHSTLNIEHSTFNISSLTFKTHRDYCSRRMPIEQRQPQGLVDILDKILDKGLVVAGDIKVSLANVELLTFQLRLVICSIDKAEAIGINWWRSDRFYSADTRALGQPGEIDELKARINQLESQLNTRTKGR